MMVTAGSGVVLVLFLAATGVGLWALIDSIVRPRWAYQAAGSNKALWIVLILVLGVIAAIIYLLFIKRRVMTAQLLGPPSAMYPGAWTAQPPGWHPDPSGRHEYRYWDGYTWTAGVSDQGIESIDPPQ